MPNTNSSSYDFEEGYARYRRHIEETGNEIYAQRYLKFPAEHVDASVPASQETDVAARDIRWFTTAMYFARHAFGWMREADKAWALTREAQALVQERNARILLLQEAVLRSTSSFTEEELSSFFAPLNSDEELQHFGLLR